MSPLSRRALSFVFGGWLFIGILSGAETYVFRGIAGHPASLALCICARTPPWLVFALATPLVVALARRWRPVRARVVLGHVAVFVAVSVAFSAIYSLLEVWTGLAPDLARQRLAFTPRLLQSLLGWSSVLILAYVGTLVVGVALAALAERNRSELLRAALATQMAEARLVALTAQLQPHFLFNALNTMLSFVRARDHVQAERAILLLSDMLRDLLRAREKSELPLDDELTMLERYLALQELRFSDRLRVTWEIEPPARACLVPALLLQPIVENAVRHGLAARRDAGRLRIAARLAAGRLVLEVEDDGPGLPRGFDLACAGGVGLRNTRERLATRYGDAATLTLSDGKAGGLQVTISLPRP
jgi:signal transduction histidine kinase